MCGICGFIDFKGQSDGQVLATMVETLRHRGPDDTGCDVFRSGPASIGLGQTRLSILDVTSAGHQPMQYGELTVVLNGEIYNFKEIREELFRRGHAFKSQSDTEVVLHSFAEWGPGCVSRFIGMFVFVIWNSRTHELTITRDRAGVKPLFYYWQDGLFLFASELKAFHKHERFRKEVDPIAVQEYMDFGYVPSPYCIFKNCHKLNPGHSLSLRTDTAEMSISKYWDVKDYYCRPSLDIPYEEAKNQLETIMASAFEYRMVSDVPVGAFFSGGYDSTALVALLQKDRTRKLKTFTIGHEGAANEAPFAREIARYLGTDHTEYYCTTKEAQEIIPTLPYYYDEPFADDSAIPTILVSKVARKDVKVALSADAGDETFAGYPDHKNFQANLAFLARIPVGVRGILSRALKLGGPAIPGEPLRRKAQVLAELLRMDEKRIPQSLFRSYMSLSDSHRKGLFKKQEPLRFTAYDGDMSMVKDALSVALAIDYSMYMLNTILVKVDRATMSVSLEGREPLLDHRIIEFAAQLPSAYKYNTMSKRILREIVHKYVPIHMVDRPKTGFDVPIYSWLRSDLSWMLDEYLGVEPLTNSGFFDPGYVQVLRQAFYRGKLSKPALLWKLLQFQLWYSLWMKT